jgi:hypothetical protein
MKYRFLLLLVAAAICLSTPLNAANQGQAEVPFDATLVNPCNGELVDIGGTVHVDVTLTSNNNTFHLTLHANPQGATGVGESTGATYHATGVTRQDEQVRLINGSAKASYVNRFDIVADGGVPSFSVHETAHVTFNANGDVTASFDKLSTSCP